MGGYQPAARGHSPSRTTSRVSEVTALADAHRLNGHYGPLPLKLLCRRGVGPESAPVADGEGVQDGLDLQDDVGWRAGERGGVDD